MSEYFEKIKGLIEETERDIEKFYKKNNKAAGTRVRQRMQEVKSLAQELRMEILEKIKKSR